MMNFETLFNNEFYDFFQWFGNTVVMTGLTLILKFFIITITAYGFAKMKFPGRDAIFLVLLAGLMIPSDIMIMPRYIIFKNLGILNTMWSLILPAAVDVYFVFLLRQAFVAVPEALSEAARIDGCSHFTIYRFVRRPLDQGTGQGRIPAAGLLHRGLYRPPPLWLAPRADGRRLCPSGRLRGGPERAVPPSGSFQRVRTYRLNFYDTDPVARGGFEAVQPPQRYGDMEALNAFIARMNGDGFLCCYNHPYWSLQNCTDYQGLQGVFAMEIYNHGCELDGLYGYAPQAYDEMLRAGQKLFCVATDDNHDVYAPGDPRCDSFGGFTMFKLEKLTYASVIEAMKKGDFYASNGPEIQELSIRDGALCVRCSPVEKIYVVTSGRRCLMQLAAPGQTLTEASFPLSGDEGYVRVDCRDGQGRHACSNAYWLDG